MDNVLICDMTFKDLDNISPLLESDFDDFWSKQTLKSELENINSSCFVAKIGDNIIGFITVWKALFDIHITNIVVKKEFRRRGIGSKLLEYVINNVKDKNLETITLEVKNSNLFAQRLYEKYGFKKVGVRRKYYNNTEDALIMTREVTNEKK